jgi:hypothetical protein
VRESRTPGSARGVLSNGHSYRNSMSSSTHSVYPRQQTRTFGSPPILPPHEWAGLPAYLFKQNQTISRSRG